MAKVKVIGAHVLRSAQEESLYGAPFLLPENN
jgi:hypothetical protein